MIGMERSATAHLPATNVWLERGEGAAKAAASAARGLFVWLRPALAAFERAQARSAARSALYRLDDRLLKDIGLRRDQVAGTVDEMFRGRDAAAAGVTVEMNAKADSGDVDVYRSAA